MAEVEKIEINNHEIKRNFYKGHIPWNKGLKGVYSEETLKMMRDNSKGKNLGKKRPKEICEKIRNARIGIKFGPMSEEHKEKIRKALLNNPYEHKNGKSRKGIKTGIVPKSAFKKGVKPWNYIDGRSGGARYTDRYGIEWPKIRQQVLIRDKYVCQKCRIDNVVFEVHHIIPYLLTRDNSLDNLVTLCKKCHRKIEAMEMRLMKNKIVA